MSHLGLTGLPPSFKLPLISQEATEGTSVILRCELSKTAPSVEWRRGGQLLKNGDKYQIRKKDLQVEMKIADLSLEDAGDYTCVCGDQMTKATVIVNGGSEHNSLMFDKMFLQILCPLFNIPPLVVFSRTTHQIPSRAKEHSGAGRQRSDALL